MLDLSIYKTRYFEIKLDENTIINIEPPKKKQLKKILALTKSVNDKNFSEEDIDNLYEAAEIAISKNKEGKQFKAEDIENVLDLSALVAFFDGYYTWVMKNVNQKN